MNTTMKLFIAATACAGVASAAFAHGHGGGKGPRAERMFERMDTDGDGRVSREDARTFAAARFARLDTNSDGQVTKDERHAGRKARQSERIAQMDTNGDGLISQADMMAAAQDRAARRFARLDTDGDGFISVADMTEKRVRHHRKRGESRGGKRGPITQAMMEERVLKRFTRLDTDGDGIITMEDVRGR